MPRPLPQLIPPHWDHLFHAMRAAYEGETDVWRRVTEGLRDAIVDHAVRHSPYYRRTIPLGGSFEDIPVLTKPTLREHLAEIADPDLPEERRIRARTSGSSGEPLAFDRDSAQQLAETTASDRFFRWLHGVPLEATIIAPQTRAVGETEAYGRWGRFLERIRSRAAGLPPSDPWIYPISMADISAADVPRHLRTWERFRSPVFISGHASGIGWLAEQIEEQGLSVSKPPAAIGATSEALTELARNRIERIFRAPVHMRYGSIEIPWLAASVPGRTDEYLINPLLAYLEVLDGEGRPCPPGVPGRIVLTDLNNRVTPLIRYDQGDIGALSPRGAIGGFPIIEQLLGRSSDVIRLPSGRMLGPATVGNVVAKTPSLAPSVRTFQCAQVAENTLELRVVWLRPPADALRAEMIDLIRRVADPDTIVTLRDIDEAQRLPSGKTWVVRRELDEP